MPPSKPSKLVERFKTKQRVADSQRNRNRFTEHQSQNVRRREEEQVRSVGDFSSTASQFSSGTSVASQAGNPFDSTARRYHNASPADGNDTQAFMSSAENRKRQRRFGDDSNDRDSGSRFERRGGYASGRGRGGGRGGGQLAVPQAAISSRTYSGMRTRGRDRFNLHDDQDRSGASAGASDYANEEYSLLGRRTSVPVFQPSAKNASTAPKSTSTLGGAGLFADSGRSVRRGMSANSSSATTGVSMSGAASRADSDDNDDEDGESSAKKTRLERFQEVVSNSKSHRIELQRERAERQRETTSLDQAFKDIQHLLPMRDRRREDQLAFEALGTPEVRALLEQHRSNRPAKMLKITKSGDAVVLPLGGGGEGEAAGSSSSAVSAPVGEETSKHAALDASSKSLLQRIYAGEGKEEGAGEQSVAKPQPTAAADAQRSSTEKRSADVDDSDDFDRLMNAMRLEKKKAHAVDRTATEEEEAAQAELEAQLAADRGAVPHLGLEDRDQVQLTRGEWLQQGGDHVHRMDEMDEAAEDDNVVLPEFTDSDDDDEQDGDSDEAEPESAATTGSTQVVDAALVEIERLVKEAVAAAKSGDAAAFEKKAVAWSATLEAVLLKLHSYGKRHVIQLTQTFRLLLVEAEREFLKTRKPPSQLILVYLLCILKLFPMSDYRHEVTTPFLIFLCSALIQSKLNSDRDIKAYAVLTSMLADALLLGGSKYTAEAVVAALNVVALQLPLKILEPVKFHGLAVSFPILERTSDAVYSNSGEDRSESTGSASDEKANASASAYFGWSKDLWRPLSILKDVVHSKTSTNGEAVEVNHDDEEAEQQVPSFTPQNSAQVLINAYRTLYSLACAWSHVPAFAYLMADPMYELDALLSKHLDKSWMKKHDPTALKMFEGLDRSSYEECSKHSATASSKAEQQNPTLFWRPHPDVLRAHVHLVQCVRAFEKNVAEHRTPLAMRTTRPRPLRLFDPMLQEALDPEKAEERMLKRTLRDDKKRVVRHVQAEATVERRLREKESALDEAQRLHKYNQLMGDLQRQQHIMSTVDSLMGKAKSKKKKSISGAPTSGGGEGGDDAGVPQY